MVYVSEVYKCNRHKRWRHTTIAYMVADSTAELHLAAERISLKRSWFTGRCYNLTVPRREAALRIGAIFIDDGMKFAQIAREMLDGVRNQGKGQGNPGENRPVTGDGKDVAGTAGDIPSS
jgi:hypothetical protein